MTRKPIAQLTRYEILDALLEDGYVLESSADALDVATTIQRAARRGCLVWTQQHIVSTLASCPLHLVPLHAEEQS